jgi:CubicO group peptidase (beta-lactamase class C family)
MRRPQTVAGLVTTAVCAALIALPGGAAAAAGDELKHCKLPAPGEPVERATPEQVGLDPADVDAAILNAVTHNRLSVRIHRNNCLVATAPQDAVTSQIPWNVFSSTKSVTSLAVGEAWADGAVSLHDPIGRYLPKGLGDAAHRRIKVRDLLTMTAGLKQSILSEVGGTGSEPNIVKQALALPIIHERGTYFEYTQRVPDLAAYVVERAVGQDFQSYVQERIFDPIGIQPSDYFWLRDRSGHTYGYAHLFIKSEAFSHIGLLLGNGGRWGGDRIVAKGYMRRMTTPTRTNPCYGFYFWLNRRNDCVTASFPSRRVIPGHRMIPSAPKDLYATVGALQQNNFVLPGLDMVVTWTGINGDSILDPQGAISANPGSTLYHDFFSELLRGVDDASVPETAPYPGDDPNLNFDIDQFADPLILLGGLGVGPYAPKDCNVLVCGEDDLTRGPRLIVADVIRSVEGLIAGD